MKIKMTREALLAAINPLTKISTKGIVGPDSPVGLVRINTTRRGVQFSAGDATKEARYHVDMAFERPGTTVVNTRKLYSLARLLPDGQVMSLEDDGTQYARIKAGRSRFTINNHPHNLFTLIPEDHKAGEILGRLHVPSRDLRHGLQSTAFAMGKPGQGKDHIASLQFSVDILGELCLVATDGSRLAKKLVKVKADASSVFVLGFDSVNEILSLLDDTDQPVDLSWTSSAVSITIGPTTYQTLLHGLSFPEWSSILPDKTESVLVERNVFLEAIRRASVVYVNSQTPLLLDIESDAIGISVASKEEDKASMTESIPARYSAEAMRIGFQIDFLIQAIEAIDEADHIRLGVRSSGASVTLEPSNEDGSFHLIMPMRV